VWCSITKRIARVRCAYVEVMYMLTSTGRARLALDGAQLFTACGGRFTDASGGEQHHSGFLYELYPASIASG
jgi:hypothetical protein